MKNTHGFSLVEIMIVVAILALLAAIAIPNLIRAKVTANESSAQATLKTISTALENYAVLNHVYPDQTTALLSSSPPYLNLDYFSDTHYGYTYAHSLTAYSYSITATPVNANSGTATYTITTGGILTKL